MLKEFLIKKYSSLNRWINQEKIEAYRLYDRELTEYPLSIDIYNKYPHIFIYHNNSIVLQNLKEIVFLSLQAIFPDLQQSDIYYKIKKKQKSGSQYEKFDDRSKKISIRENSISYWINLTDYLDTGIFLDHRSTRKIFSELVKNKRRVLNLFSYTGAFSLVAASSGVEFTTSVDMSNTYCEWARENIRLNHFDPHKHIVIRDNVFFFLENIKTRNWKFDFVVIDPPTMSRSKKMTNKFDIQRDYPYLINTASEFLNPGGKILFSTNFRKFKFNPDLINLKDIEDITEATIPPDFHDSLIHKVYIINKHNT